ncbi:hypothetical protein ACFWP7_28670 [Streptomyces sp. NPDC058470]|uniref:hypothetical protein n=1 Tax=Streptomyces sp. NPDC058470 TaxID=3346515 RepID=UPI003650E5DC
MMRILFGAILGLLVAYPALLAFVLAVVAVVAAIVSQPVVLAFAAGVLLWPRIARTVRRWAA